MGAPSTRIEQAFTVTYPPQAAWLWLTSSSNLGVFNTTRPLDHGPPKSHLTMTGHTAAGSVPTETSPLLSSSRRDSTSSSESSLTSSFDSDGSDDDFTPWYFRPSAELTDAHSGTEAEALLPEQNGRKQAQPKASSTILRIISILLIGTFTANADGSLVLATHPTIASEFNALSASSWLFVSFSLAGAATQTMVRKVRSRSARLRADMRCSMAS